MAENKTTKREYFTMVQEVALGLGRTDLAEFAEREYDLLTRKGAKSDAPTANQIANQAVKVQILGTLDVTEGKRATDIASEIGTSVQKVTALVKQMVENDKTVVRTVDKKAVTFTLAGESEVEAAE